MAKKIILILLPLLVILTGDKSRFSTKKILSHLAISAVILTPLLLFYFLQIVYLGIIVIKDTDWTDDWPRRFAILKTNLPLNLAFWFREKHPVCVTILAIWGLIRLSGQKNGSLKYSQSQSEKSAFRLRNNKTALFLTIWFCAFLLIYSLHYTACFGAITAVECDRHALNLYISIVIFALANRLPAIKKYTATAILLFCILLNSIHSFQTAIHKTLNDEKHKEYILLLRHKDKIPDNTYVITYNVNMIISTIRKKAITPHEFLLLDPKPQEAVLFKNYWFFKEKLESEYLENYLKKHYDFAILWHNKDQQNPSCLIKLTARKEIESP